MDDGDTTDSEWEADTSKTKSLSNILFLARRLFLLQPTTEGNWRPVKGQIFWLLVHISLDNDVCARCWDLNLDQNGSIMRSKRSQRFDIFSRGAEMCNTLLNYVGRTLEFLDGEMITYCSRAQRARLVGWPCRRLPWCRPPLPHCRWCWIQALPQRLPWSFCGSEITQKQEIILNQ